MAERDEKTREQLVNLVINQDRVVEAWIKLLLAVQAGLIVILGFVLKPSEPGPQSGADPRLRTAMCFLIPFLGFGFSIFVGWIVGWERKWARWFTRRITDDGLKNESVYPTKSGVIGQEPLGPVSKAIWVLVSFIALGWTIAFVIL